FEIAGGGHRGSLLSSRLVEDLRFAGRVIRRRPGAALLIVFSLALGIAGVTITFSLADGILWHPLPFQNAGRFARVALMPPRGASLTADVALGAWVERNRVLDGIYPFGLDSAIITVGGEPEAVTLAELSDGVFVTLGVSPVHGRLFTADEHVPGSNVIVASEDLWQRVQRAESSDPTPTILVEGVSTTIVGVMPRAFAFPVGRVAFWRPYVTSQPVRRVSGLGLLKPGVTSAEAGAIARTATPQQMRGLLQQVTVSPFVFVNPTTSNSMYVLMGAVGLLLLIAVANAAHVTMSEATRRDTEIAVRTALGAPRWTIARQMIVQALVLSTAATTLAVILSAWVLRVTIASIPYLLSFQSLRPIGIDWRALLCAASVATVAGLGAASFAILRARRIDAQTALRGQTTATSSRGKLSRLLTATQLAITLALLTSAGTLGRSLMATESTGLQVEPDHVVEVMVQLTTAQLANDAALQLKLSQLRGEAARLPGVASATISYSQPPSLGSRPLSDLTVDDNIVPSSGTVFYGRIDEGFFDTLGIRLLTGRGIEARDTSTAQPVAVVSRALGERLWPGGQPVGHRFRASSEEPWLTVVGVAADIHNTNVDQESDDLSFYTPRSQSPAWWFEGVTVRTVPLANTVVPDLRTLIRAQLPDSPIIDVTTGADRLSNLNARVRFVSSIITTFALVALALALIGVYGAFWFVVGQRTREMAMRLAIGASPANVIRLVLGSSLRLVGVGILVGVPLGIASTAALQSLVVGLPAADPLVLGGAGILLTAAALGATYLPARRASRIDPVHALRQS
ncbi:MAG: FtsX-like permease family protein, partial [Vicinamibacterales bacterium]